MGIPLQKRSDLDESCEIDNDNDERDANLSASLRASAKTAAAEAALADAECTAVQDAMRSSQQMTDGDSWYLLSFKWWTEWKNFAMYGDDDLAAAATTSSAATTSAEATPLDKSIKVSVERPGPIDNLDLLDVRCRAKLGKGKPDASPSSYDAATPSSGAELSNGTGASSPSLSSPSINGVNGENGSTDEVAPSRCSTRYSPSNEPRTSNASRPSWCLESTTRWCPRPCGSCWCSGMVSTTPSAAR